MSPLPAVHTLCTTLRLYLQAHTCLCLCVTKGSHVCTYILSHLRVCADACVCLHMCLCDAVCVYTHVHVCSKKVGCGTAPSKRITM